jgi:hypothetical protein
VVSGRWILDYIYLLSSSLFVLKFHIRQHLSPLNRSPRSSGRSNSKHADFREFQFQSHVDRIKFTPTSISRIHHCNPHAEASKSLIRSSSLSPQLLPSSSNPNSSLSTSPAVLRPPHHASHPAARRATPPQSSLHQMRKTPIHIFSGTVERC